MLPELYAGEDFIPGIHSRVTGLCVYEGGFSRHVPTSQRRYGNRFAKSSTRVIWWEFELAHDPPAGADRAFTVQCMYTKGNDVFPTFQSSVRSSDPVGSSQSIHTSGYGFKLPGKWQPGTYQMVLLINHHVVAARNFTVFD